ncbi:hypothetical protein ACTJIJ_15635 [Niabella sp. 22666]|uniref:hypothetical protein n=1 Tax=Niabella sp. 22666 TaxID=3453954 RepID=UPI003F850D60
MKEATTTPTTSSQVYFSPVQVSDLSVIRELYRKRQQSVQAPAGSSPARDLLTADFGCPLYIARSQEKVIGYSYVCISESGEILFDAVIDTAYTGLQWEHQLIALSKKQYKGNTLFANPKKQKEANERLVNWLNGCL